MSSLSSTLPPAESPSTTSSPAPTKLFGSPITSQLATITESQTQFRAKSLPDLPRLTITHGHRKGDYVLEGWVSLSKKKRTSWINKYGVYLVDILGAETLGRTYWNCNLCNRQRRITMYVESASAAAMRPLRAKHQVVEGEK